LSGEIHSDWRDVVKRGIADRNLPVQVTHPNLSHEDSDDCGAIILGDEAVRLNYDNKGARMNLIRTRTLLEEADIVCVRFGEKYRQWNAAFDAGYAIAKGIPVITLHPESLGHMLKEVNAGAVAVCKEPEQIVDILDYTITGFLFRSVSTCLSSITQRLSHHSTLFFLNMLHSCTRRITHGNYQMFPHVRVQQQ
jgi:YtoQ family protein